jgi:hypothetical protein
MSILAGSRYLEGDMMWVASSRGNKQTVYLNTMTSLTSPYSLAMMREGDNMTLLAQQAYKDPDRWWRVADANPQWFYPLDSWPGDSLRVPQ